MITKPHAICLLLSCFLSAGLSGQNKKVTQTAPETWVKPTTLEPDAQFSQDDTGGFYYLLLDNQDNLATAAHYTRRAYKILNNQGVQDMGEVSIDFDPEYQEVRLHHVHIIRKGEIIDKTDSDHAQVIQRETNRERKIYDGRLTYINTLTDLRKGDIVDYAFTVVGANPVHLGKYDNSIIFDYSIPYHLYKYRIVAASRTDLAIKNLKGAPEPVIEEDSRSKVYSWSLKNGKAIQYETATPSWYDPARFIDISQFKDWGEVVGQYGPLYDLNNNDRKLLKAKASDLLHDVSDSLKTTRLIRFVQDEVRYLGFENGLHSFRPSRPLAVIDRRYGDCKDKSFLLCELLKTQGVEAYPMLVNSYLGRGLHTRLPSAKVFDHCVVQVKEADGSLYYIDPTIDNQGGPADATYFPDYGYGLVLKQGNDGLTKLPLAPMTKTEILETFTLDDVGAGADLEIKTTYTGMQADLRRQQFAYDDLNTIQQEYVAYYNNLYPDLRAVGAVDYVDFSASENQFTTIEHYRIDSLWVPAPKDENTVYCTFYPLPLDDVLYPTQAADRKMPYATAGRFEIDHRTIVFVPKMWNIKNEDMHVETKDFAYTNTISYKNARLDIGHNYKSLSSFVAAADLAEYSRQHVKAQERMNYQLTHPKEGTDVVVEESAGLSGSSKFIGVLCLGILGFIGYTIFGRSKKPTQS